VRICRRYVNKQLVNEIHYLRDAQQKSDCLGQLEALFNEPSGNGIGIKAISALSLSLLGNFRDPIQN